MRDCEDHTARREGCNNHAIIARERVQCKDCALQDKTGIKVILSMLLI